MTCFYFERFSQHDSEDDLTALKAPKHIFSNLEDKLGVQLRTLRTNAFEEFDSI